MTDTTIKRDAYCIAAQVLAIEVLHRRRRHAPCDVRDIAVTVHIDELVHALRELGINKRPDEPEVTQHVHSTNGRKHTRRRPRR